MNKRTTILRYVLCFTLLFFLSGCDVFVPDSEESTDAESNETQEELVNNWDGDYGGATDIYIRENGQLSEVYSNNEISLTLDVNFSDGDYSSDIDFSVSGFYGSYIEGDGYPTKITKDSLIVIFRDGNIQTDYVVEKDNREISGEVRVFEQDSEGEYSPLQVYDFTADENFN